MTTPRYYFPGCDQPGSDVQRVRFTHAVTPWFERVTLPSGDVWRSTGPGAGATDGDWSWRQLNTAALVDCTAEVEQAQA